MKDELYINGTLVELDGKIPFPVTHQISDLLNPDKRKGSNSKTIVIPGTENNLKLMSGVFSLSIIGQESQSTTGYFNFDPTVKATAQHYSNGVLQMRGVAQLLSSIKLPDGAGWQFELTLFSDFINFMNDLKKVNVNELSCWSEYDHTLNISNVQSSLSGMVYKNGALVSNKTGSDWDGFGYYYGLIDYGFPRLADDTWRLNEVVPQVWPYEILKKSFETIGFKFQSEFLESDFFKRQVVAWQGGELPEVSAAIQTAQSIYVEEENSITGGHSVKGLFPLGTFTKPEDVGTPEEGRRYYHFGDVSANQSAMNPMNISVITDNSNQVGDDFPFNLTIFNDGVYDLNYAGTVQLNSRIIELIDTGGLEATNYANGTMKFGFYVVIKKNNVILETINLHNYLFSVGFNTQIQNIPFDIERTFQLNSNDVISFELEIKTVLCQGAFDPPALTGGDVAFVQEYTVSVLTTKPTLNLIRTATNFVPGQTVKLRYFVPQMDAAEYFRGIFLKWNLQIMPDPNDDKLLLIEPLEEFYKGTDESDDWTSLVDTSKVAEVIPTASIAAKRYIYAFKDDGDEFNERYRAETNEQYGSKTLPSNVDFADKDAVTTLPFSNKPICEVPNTNLIVPRTFQVQEGVIKPKKGSPFHVFIGSTSVTAFPGSWILVNELGVSVPLTHFPYVGHLDNYLSPTFDLNFGVPKFVFYGSTAYTNSNLWQNHERFVLEIVDRYGKIYKGSFTLTRAHINQLDFSRLKMIDGVAFRLQKVVDYDSTKKDASTVCELIRVIKTKKSISGSPTLPDDEGDISPQNQGS